MVPVHALQRDEAHFVEPLLYKPERFLGKEQTNAAHMGLGLSAGNSVGESSFWSIICFLQLPTHNLL